MNVLVALFRRGAWPSLVALASVVCILGGCVVFVDSLGFGTAYVDTNCNGMKDPEETPLAGVCVWTSADPLEPTPSREECRSEYLQTDSEGISDVGWFSGRSCDDVFVFAQAPNGFQPTTDTVVNGCEGGFGFAPEGICPPQRSVTAQELVRRGQMRCLAWAVGLPGVLLFLALGYRRLRRDALARHETRSGE